MKSKFTLGLLALGLWAINLAAQSVNTVIAPELSVFSTPAGAAVDAAENIYVTDADLHRIVQFTASNGILKTLTGTGGQFGSANGPLASAQFYAPRGIVYARGGLFVADSGNHTIRFINLSTKTVSTVAGRTRTQGAADGPALDARFSSPYGLAADADGNIYIADSRNGSIRVLDTANNVRTLATDFQEPTGLALTESKQLIVSDRAAHQIYLVETNGTKRLLAGDGTAGYDDGPAAEARFSAPEAVIHLGANFGAVVSDGGNHVLRRIITSTNTGLSTVELYAGAPRQTNTTDGILAESRFNLPTVLTRYQTGFLVVDEGNKSLRQVLPQPQLPRISNPKIGHVIVVVDPDTGRSKLALVEVTDATFDNDVVIAVLGEDNVVNYYTFGPAPVDLADPDTVPDPRTSQSTAQPYRNGAPVEDMPPSLVGRTLPETLIKTQSRANGRTPSDVVQATFRFKVTAPRIDASNPNAILLRTTTTNASIYYTLDGSDPTEGYVEGHATKTNRNTLGPKSSGETISIPLTGAKVTLKVRAFREGYRASDLASMDLSQETVTPNRISLGFTGGEGSSEFVAAAGQRFYVPVTMTLLPGQIMHGLQFSMLLENGSGPPPPSAANYAYAFQSMLMLKDAFAQAYTNIPPSMFVGTEPVVQFFTNIVGTVTNVTSFTNYQSVYTNLLSTNLSSGLLSVGWLERSIDPDAFDGIYDPDLQHLVQYSSAHDTIFDSKNSKVIVGAYSFVVPPAAAPGQTYKLRLIRPSATVNLSDDVYLEAPYEENPYTSLRAAQFVTVSTNRSYVVGDVAPFRWLNAGDFGDTNILNNDVMQIFQSAVYMVNTPQPGSDFYDAMDTCCNGADGLPVSSGNLFDGNDTNTINSIVFGDGVLDVRDIIVAFRRGLDPKLKWFGRFWLPNGTLGYVEVPNQFRGSTNLSSTGKIQPLSVLDESGPSTFKLSLESTEANAGDFVTLPLRAEISGKALRGLTFKARVRGLHRAPGVLSTSFQPADLGSPIFSDNNELSFAGAWWRPTGLQGQANLGALRIQIPTNAPAGAIYIVELENVSATGDGLNSHQITSYPAVVHIGEGASITWNDSISAEWRKLHFGHLANPASAPDADPDRDGVSNLAEYQAGTNPVQTTSHLELTLTPAATGMRLNWHGVAGKVYRVESRGALGSGSWTPVTDITGVGGPAHYTPEGGNSSAFFRVRVLP